MSFFEGASKALAAVKALNDELIRMREQAAALKENAAKLELALVEMDRRHRCEVDDLRRRMAELEARFNAAVEKSVIMATEGAVRDHINATGNVPSIVAVNRGLTKRRPREAPVLPAKE